MNIFVRSLRPENAKKQPEKKFQIYKF